MADKNGITALTPAQVNSWPVKGTSTATVTGERGAVDANVSSSVSRKQRILDVARDRFQLCVDAEAHRRSQMQEDLRFACGLQWDQQIVNKRTAKGRPSHTINRVDSFVKHVVNNMRQSRPAIKVDPVGDALADDDQAEIRQGLIRHIEVTSQADAVYDGAFGAMCTTGLGWMRVVDDWASPDSFDKDLFIRSISNTFSVYCDPDTKMPDWSDMKFAFVHEDLSLSEFKMRWKDAAAADLANFQSIGDAKANWAITSPHGPLIRVAEYFYVEQTDDVLIDIEGEGPKLLSAQDEEDQNYFKAVIPTGETDKRLELLSGKAVTRSRKCKIPEVHWCLITGVDILTERKWKGRYIPLIPVIGNQIELDGNRLLVGMVRYAREVQRVYNYIWSCIVELVALAPRNQYVIAEGQIEGYEQIWEGANRDPVVALPYKMQTAPNGTPLPPPVRQSAAVEVQGYVQILALADNMMKAIFSIYDASLGQRGAQESGLAINARKIESDTGTYDWGDNFIRAQRYLGRVVNDLLQFYYNTPGRIVQIMQEDEITKQVVLNQDFEEKGETKKYDLSKGKYEVVISTGPSQNTQRKEAMDALIEIGKTYPPAIQVIIDLMVNEMSFPGKDAIVARLKKILPPGVQEQDPNEAPDPGQLQQKVAELMQMVQGLTAALHEATDKNSGERMKEEFATFREQMKQETNLALGQLKVGSDEAKFMNEKVFAELERVRATLESTLAQSAGGQEGQPAAPAMPAAPQSLGAGPDTAPGQVSGGGA